jgi:hypothetical protein
MVESGKFEIRMTRAKRVRICRLFFDIGTNLVLGTGEAGLNGKMLQVAGCRAKRLAGTFEGVEGRGRFMNIKITKRTQFFRKKANESA